MKLFLITYTEKLVERFVVKYMVKSKFLFEVNFLSVAAL